MINKPLFVVDNLHDTTNNKPPFFAANVTGNPDFYHAYFENRCGQQAIFQYQRSTDQARLFGGDWGWANHKSVKIDIGNDLIDVDLVLSQEEIAWLRVCLQTCGMYRRALLAAEILAGGIPNRGDVYVRGKARREVLEVFSWGDSLRVRWFSQARHRPQSSPYGPFLVWASKATKTPAPSAQENDC